MSTLYKGKVRTSLAVQWLRLHASNVGGMGWIPGQGAKITNATIHGQKKKKKVANSNKWDIPNTSSDTIEKKTSELIS